VHRRPTAPLPVHMALHFHSVSPGGSISKSVAGFQKAIAEGLGDANVEDVFG